MFSSSYHFYDLYFNLLDFSFDQVILYQGNQYELEIIEYFHIENSQYQNSHSPLTLNTNHLTFRQSSQMKSLVELFSSKSFMHNSPLFLTGEDVLKKKFLRLWGENKNIFESEISSLCENVTILHQRLSPLILSLENWYQSKFYHKFQRLKLSNRLVTDLDQMTRCLQEEKILKVYMSRHFCERKKIENECSVEIEYIPDNFFLVDQNQIYGILKQEKKWNFIAI